MGQVIEGANGKKSDGYDGLGLELVQRFPQLRPMYLELKKLWDDAEPGPHIVYGDALVPYMTDLLTQNSNVPAIKEVFLFLEELLLRGDIRIRDLIGSSVLEVVYDDPAARLVAEQYMGRATHQLARHIGDWNRA